MFFAPNSYLCLLLESWQPTSFTTTDITPFLSYPVVNANPVTRFIKSQNNHPRYHRDTLYITPPEYNIPGDERFRGPNVIAEGVAYTVVYGSQGGNLFKANANDVVRPFCFRRLTCAWCAPHLAATDHRPLYVCSLRENSSPATPVRHDAWIVAPFFKAGGRITAGDIHFVEQAGGSGDSEAVLVPAGETEFARDAAFGYRSSNLVDWIGEKSAVAGGEIEKPEATEHVTSVSLEDLRKGGPAAVRKRLAEAKGGCVVVNAVEERDLQVRW